MAAHTPDEGNIFQVKDYDDAYWTNYLAARPKYHESGFYDEVFAYHDAHSADYDTVHDVGTGPGQVAGMLMQRFKHVVASDMEQTHLNICKHRTASGAYADQMTFVLCKGEELAAHVPPGSADAVFSGEALALMDFNKAVESFAKVLKPGGTLAVWYYGRPMFAEGDSSTLCQSLYKEIANRQFGRIIKGGPPAKTAFWKDTTDCMASWLDSVRFSEAQWKDVRRHKWNTHGKMTFYDEAACDFKFEVSSAITEGEIVSEKRDEDLWAEQ